MTWVLTDTSGVLTGSATIATPLGSVVLTGRVSGTLTGSNVAFTIDVPAGGVAGQPACTVTVTGSATVNAARTAVSGSYSGSGNCTPVFTNGMLSLTRR